MAVKEIVDERTGVIYRSAPGVSVPVIREPIKRTNDGMKAVLAKVVAAPGTKDLTAEQLLKLGEMSRRQRRAELSKLRRAK